MYCAFFVTFLALSFVCFIRYSLLGGRQVVFHLLGVGRWLEAPCGVLDERFSIGPWESQNARCATGSTGDGLSFHVSDSLDARI